MPTVRKWYVILLPTLISCSHSFAFYREQEPTLREQIYDSFGFSIPLIQFHNITNRQPTPPTIDESDSTQQESNYDSDGEADWMDDGSLDMQSQGKNDQIQSGFVLQYNGNRKRVTEQHPYVVTR